jgi:arabinogalactan oligomer/maltooligosaccharide transport system substrate-binding protein
MVSKEAQTTFVDVAAHVPANDGVLIIDPLVDSFADAIDQGYAWPHAEAMSDYWGNFDRAWNRVLVDGVEPATAVEEACAAMDAASGG